MVRCLKYSRTMKGFKKTCPLGVKQPDTKWSDWKKKALILNGFIKPTLRRPNEYLLNSCTNKVAKTVDTTTSVSTNSFFKRGILQAKSIYPPMMGRTTEVAAVEETIFENMRVADAAQSMKGFG